MSEKSLALAGRWPSTFVSLRYRNYRRWFVGQALSLMGTWMQSVAQGWLVYQLTGSKLALGTITFFGTIPSLVLMLPAGAVADRVSRRRLLMMTQASMMILALALAVLTAAGAVRLWHIAVLAFGLGIANSFDAPARLALAVEMVEDRRDLHNAIALNSTMFNLARVIGPTIGGAVLATLGPAWCFAINGLSFLAVIVALLGMRLPPAEISARSGRLVLQVADGLRYVWNNPPVRAVIAMVGVATLFGFSYSVLMPAFAVDVLHVGEAGLGFLNAAVGVGALTGALTAATLGRSRYRGWQLAIGSLLFPVALTGFALSRAFPVSLAWLGLVGFAFISQNATSNTLVQTVVPDELRGRVMSVYSLLFFGTAPIGSLAAGAAAQRFGPSAAVVGGAIIILAFALYIFFAVPTVREMGG